MTAIGTVAKIKARVRDRDHCRCVDCGMSEVESFAKWGKTLDVHRLVPDSEYTLEGCVTVCRTCHGIRHRTESFKDRSPRDGRQFQFWIASDLAEALDAFMDSLEYKTTYKSVFETALRSYLESKGFQRPPK